MVQITGSADISLKDLGIDMQSKRLMRIYNKNKILDLIRKNHSIYRAELARLTGLSMPTIMNITDELIDDGLIRDAGKGISSGGNRLCCWNLYLSHTCLLEWI